MTTTVDAERWLPVVGWEGRYEVSDHGRVRTVEHVVIRRDGFRRTILFDSSGLRGGTGGAPSRSLTDADPS